MQRDDSVNVNELTGNNDNSHLNTAKDKRTYTNSSKPTATAYKSKSKKSTNEKYLSSTTTISAQNHYLNATQCEVSIPFGSSLVMHKSAKQKQSDLVQSTNARKRSRPSITRRGRGRGRGRDRSTSSFSS